MSRPPCRAAHSEFANTLAVSLSLNATIIKIIADKRTNAPNILASRRAIPLVMIIRLSLLPLTVAAVDHAVHEQRHGHGRAPGDPAVFVAARSMRFAPAPRQRVSCKPDPQRTASRHHAGDNRRLSGPRRVAPNRKRHRLYERVMQQSSCGLQSGHMVPGQSWRAYP